MPIIPKKDLRSLGLAFVIWIVLAVLFIVLKLTGLTSWDWIWVLVPVYFWPLCIIAPALLSTLIGIGGYIRKKSANPYDTRTWR
jgi:hypothetical protein